MSEETTRALQIRAYRPQTDRDALLRCFIELQEHERELDPDLRPGDEIAESYLAHLFSECAATGGRIFVALNEDEVVGYVAVMVRMMPDPLDSLPHPYAYVHDLVVADALRGRGGGKALLERAEAFAREAGAERMRLHVLANNRAAVAAYQSAGYAPYETCFEKTLEAGSSPESPSDSDPQKEEPR